MSRAGDPRASKPRNLAVAGRKLAVAWADGHESYYPFARLRKDCPCALCAARASEGRAPANPLRRLDESAAEEPAVTRLVPVGAYAVQIVWSDGHDTGIYSFERLRRNCPCPACAGGTAQ